MLLIFAVFMGCLLTKATLSHLWPADLLPGWNMIYVIRALCILVLSVLLTWILIKLGRLLIKITDPFFLCLITVCALGLNIADIYLGAIMNSMFILNITYTLLVIISLLIFLLIGESKTAIAIIFLNLKKNPSRSVFSGMNTRENCSL